MNKATLIKALVAGAVVVTGILIGDNEKVRGKLEKAAGIAGDVEQAIKNPLGTLARSAYASSAPKANMNYYDWQNRQDELKYEMERLKLQQAHEERMAEIKKATELTTKKEENHEQA